MITDLTIAQNAELENKQMRTVALSSKKISLKLVNEKIKQFSIWINPRHWFDSLSDIKITLEEFSCVKKEAGNNN